MMHLCLAILFFVLSPGVLLTLPPGSRGVFGSGQTSIAAAAVHALVFMVAAHLLWVYVIHPTEGFIVLKAKGESCGASKECISGSCTKDHMGTGRPQVCA